MIRKLPGLPKLSKDSSGAGGSGTGGSGAAGGAALGNFSANVGGGGGGGGGGGVFGAKQAMLERERAKEAQRVLNIRDAAFGGFPTLLSDVRPDEMGNTGDEKVKSMLRSSGEAHDETEKTVLCIGDEDGKLHLYLGGSVFLGTVPIGESTSIVGLQVLPSSSSKARFAVYSASSSTLSISRLSLPIPPSLQLVLRQSSALRATIQHAFEAFQEVRNLWDEARRIGKGWLQRIADVSRPQGGELLPILLNLRRLEILISLPPHSRPSSRDTAAPASHDWPTDSLASRLSRLEDERTRFSQMGTRDGSRAREDEESRLDECRTCDGTSHHTAA